MEQGQYIWMCPVCQTALARRDGQFLCADGHSFDLAREGYVNLVLAHQRSSSEAGDPPDSLRQRRLFLKAGHYLPLVQAVSQIAAQYVSGHVLDIGCGEGYLLRSLQKGTAHTGFHGVDVSRTAVRMAAKVSESIAYAVGNAFRLPVCADTVTLCVGMMAPRDDGEIRRVLVDGGTLLTVTPGEGHLAALRNLVYEDARPHAPVEGPPGFELIAEERVRFALDLTSPDSVRQLIEMTPYKWHMNPQTYERVSSMTSLSDAADFVVELMRPTC